MLRYAMALPGSVHVFEAERDRTAVLCQDCYHFKDDGRVIAAALCDGAGSYSHAHVGAQAMSLRVVQALVSRADFYLRRDMPQEQAAALTQVVKSEMSKLSGEWSEPEDAFSSTLLAVLMDKASGEVAAFHLGDGVILSAAGGGTLQVLSAPALSESRYATWLTSCTAEEIRQNLRVRHGTAERIFMATDGAVGTLYSADGTVVSPSVEEFIDTMKTKPDALQQLPETIRREINPFDDFSMVLLDASLPQAEQLARSQRERSLRAARRMQRYICAIDAGATERQARYAAGISARSFEKRYKPLILQRLLA